MAHQFSMIRRVEFSETDMAGIAHFANFFVWMETCERSFLRSLGQSVHGELAGKSDAVQAGREYGFARVHASCDYRRPVRFEELLRIDLRVLVKSAKGFEFGFSFHLEGESEADAAPLATGCLKVVCVSLDAAAGRPRAVNIPSAIAALVEPAP